MKYTLAILFLFPCALNAMEGEIAHEVHEFVMQPIAQQQAVNQPMLLLPPILHNQYEIKVLLSSTMGLNQRHLYFKQTDAGEFIEIVGLVDRPLHRNYIQKLLFNIADVDVSHSHSEARVSIQAINPDAISVNYSITHTDPYRPFPFWGPLSYWYTYTKTETITLPMGQEHRVNPNADDEPQNSSLATLTITALHH